MIASSREDDNVLAQNFVSFKDESVGNFLVSTSRALPNEEHHAARLLHFNERSFKSGQVTQFRKKPGE